MAVMPSSEELYGMYGPHHESVAMLLTSFFAGLVWRGVFNANIPSYLSGLIGGITAVPVWELLKRLAFH